TLVMFTTAQLSHITVAITGPQGIEEKFCVIPKERCARSVPGACIGILRRGRRADRSERCKAVPGFHRDHELFHAGDGRSSPGLAVYESAPALSVWRQVAFRGQGKLFRHLRQE